MENGWICIHRKLLDDPMMSNTKYLALWVTLLLKANHKETKIILNGKTVILKKGQFITGRIALSKSTKIPQTTIERILDWLEENEKIGQQKTTKNRIITILNWEKYQILDNKRTTNGQQTDTNNNDNNVTTVLLRNTGGLKPPPQSLDKPPNTPIKKKIQTTKFIKPTVAEVEAYCKARNNGINAQAFVDKYESIGWVVGRSRTPMKDWKATVRTWENYRKEYKFGQVLQSDQSHKIVDKMKSKTIKA